MEIPLMKEKKRRRHFIVVTGFLAVLILCLVNEYVSTPKPTDGNSYISQFLLPTTPEAENSDRSSERNAQYIATSNKSNYREEIIGIKENVFVTLEEINRTATNIFFIETRCATKKMAEFFVNISFVLNARQCCAIESTALMNLDREVYIFHSCPLKDNFLAHSPAYFTKLLSYPNVHVVKFNATDIFSNTPVQELHDTKQLERSQYPIEHTSDVIRLILLWKFGGTYCDLDVVTIRSLSALKTNWGGMQDRETIANGVINFEPEGPGHDMLQEALEYINRHFDPTNWSTNGPLLITSIILRECRVPTVTEATTNCHGNFTVYNSPILYPLYYQSAYQLFDEQTGEEIVKSVKSSSFSVHIWNKMSHNLQGKVGSTQAYALLAEEYCPQVYQNCGKYF